MQRTLITGATSGIGLETARSLAARGHELVLASRNPEKAERVAGELRAECPGAEIHLVQLDLASLASVRECAADLHRAFDHIDVLINNAGAFSMKRRETEDGFELTMGTNHLGPFLFTSLLLPLVLRAPASRIINVASDAYRYGNLRFRDFQRRRFYGGFPAYAASRLATVLFTLELADRLDDSPGSANVTVNCCHPGHVRTNIWPETGGLIGAGMRIAQRGMISAREGAEPGVHLATAAELARVTGTYFNRMWPAEVSPRCSRQKLRSALWSLSCELTGAEWSKSG